MMLSFEASVEFSGLHGGISKKIEAFTKYKTCYRFLAEVQMCINISNIYLFFLLLFNFSFNIEIK